ncbi:hypothetical protein ACX80W_11985 [Arthrobacter sp. TMN-37]
MEMWIPLTAAVGLALLTAATALLLRRPRPQQEATPRREGIRSSGLVVAVRPQTHFDRDRNNIRVPVRVEYTDPRSGEPRTGTYVLDRFTANIPALISQPVGVAAFGSPARPGHARPGPARPEPAAGALDPEADAEGFRAILDPIPVDAFISGPANDPRVRIVFRP